MLRYIKFLWTGFSAIMVLPAVWMFMMLDERYLSIHFEDGRGTDPQGFPVNDTTFVYGLVAIACLLPLASCLMYVLFQKLRRTVPEKRV